MNELAQDVLGPRCQETTKRRIEEPIDKTDWKAGRVQQVNYLERAIVGFCCESNVDRCDCVGGGARS